MLVAYVSGHGFGHATRVGVVLRRVRELQPDLRISVVSSAPERLFRSAIGSRFEYRFLECDVGVAQRGALVLDEAATAERLAEFARRYHDLVDAEWRLLRHQGARLVLGDIPPLAFQAAHEAGIPSVGLANFSWDWIYRHMAEREPSLRSAAQACAAAYARCGLLLRLPFAGDLRAFPHVEDVPLVARRPRIPRELARSSLGLDRRPAVLLSFGGFGLPGFNPYVLEAAAECQFVMTGSAGRAPANVRLLEDGAFEALGLGYEDLVGAVDAVVTKPGYGIVSDAIAAGTALVYTERGDFPEYPVLVREMPRFLRTAHVSGEDLMAGRVLEPVRRALSAPLLPPPDLGGADVAAWRIVELLARA